MKVVLTCGHPFSGYQLAHEALVSAGLAQALPSRREAISLAEWHEKICKAYGLSVAGQGDFAPVSLGMVWQNLAVDIFLGNFEQERWGWADANSIWLLEFWKEFDPKISFLLVYADPAIAVGKQLLGNLLPEADDVQRIAAEWSAFNTELLRFYHRNPERCLLVNYADVIHASPQFMEKAAQAFELELLPPTEREPVARCDFSAILPTLAKILVKDCQEAILLYQELESSADVIGSLEDPAVEIEALIAWQEYNQLLQQLEAVARTAAEETAQVESLRYAQAEQTADYQSTLAAHQAELAQMTGVQQAQAQQIEALQLQIQQAASAYNDQSEQLEQLRTKYVGLTDENGKLVEKVFQVQEDFEKAYREHTEKMTAYEAALTARQTELAQMIEARQAQAKQIEALQLQIERAAHAYSEQTQQLDGTAHKLERAAHDKAALAKQIEQLADENGKLVEKVFQVQEDFEKAYREHTEKMTAYEAALTARQTELAQMAEVRQAQAKQIEALQLQIEGAAHAYSEQTQQLDGTAHKLEQATHDRAMLAQQIERLMEVNNGLLDKVFQVQEEFEQCYREQAEQTVVQQRALVDSQSKLAQMTTAHQAQVQRADGLQAQLQQTVQAHGEQANQLAEAVRKLGQATQDKEAQAQQIAQLRTQTTSLLEGNDHLLEKILHTQEEFEQCYLALKAESKTSAEAKASLAQLREASAVQQDLLKERQKQLEQLQKAKDEQAKLATERLSKLEQASKARDEQTKLAAERQAQLEQLKKARDEQAKLATERLSKLEQASKARDEQTKLAAERQKQLEQLQKARDEQAKLATERLSKLEQVSKVRDEQTKLAAERGVQLQQASQELAKRLDEWQRTLNAKTAEIDSLKRSQNRLAETNAAEILAKQTEIAQLQTRHKNAEEENQLLLLQVHQVQEELERYFQQYQELRREKAILSIRRDAWYFSPPAEIVFDLRREFNGTNWYYPEEDGRWAGPETVSTIKLPALSGKQYEVQFSIVDAMDPDIVLGMEVSLNGTLIPLSDDWTGYPALIRGQFVVDKATANQDLWEFQLKFPLLISPAQNGADDQRNLAVRMRSIKLTCIDLALSAPMPM